MVSDNFKQARRSHPLKRLMQEHGKGPPDSKWKPFTHCPYCQDKGSASVKEHNGREWFKCFNPLCPSHTSGKSGAWDEISFLGYELRLRREEAAVAYLKAAGLWTTEEQLAQSVLSGNKPGHHTAPAQPEIAGEDEAIIQQCIEVLRAEKKGSIRRLQRLQLGFARASRIMNELEKRGVVGPAKPDNSLRDVLESSQAAAAPKAPVSGTPPDRPHLDGSGPQAEVGLGKPADDCAGSIPVGAAETKPPVNETPPLIPESDSPRIETPAPTGLPAREETSDDEKPPDAEPGYDALNYFYQQLTFSDADAGKLFLRRGLAERITRALGFKSNPRTNESVLEAMTEKFDWEELKASGLWNESKDHKDIKPNAQFAGYGITGKKEKDARNSPDDKWTWGWSEPLLIPYFDDKGNLLKLRPHKGGARSQTAAGSDQLYVPRSIDGKNSEFFPTVIITEGEFKAAALWQVLGDGNTIEDKDESMGVCALPGISYGKHFELREQLEEWLQAVRCRRVVVAFDDEEKGDPKFSSYQPDVRKRFDSQIWARYLAMDLARKLHVIDLVTTLPRNWHNANGKADWDGALAQLTH